MCLPRWCTLIKCNTEATRVAERGTVSPVTGRGFSDNGRGIMVSVLMRIMGLSSSGYNQGTKKSIIITSTIGEGNCDCFYSLWSPRKDVTKSILFWYSKNGYGGQCEWICRWSNGM